MRISKVLLCRQDCCNWKFGIVVAFDPFWVGPRSNQFKVILKLRFSKLGGFKLSPNGNTPATICVGGDTLRICWIATRNWTPWTHPTPQITRDQGLTLEVEKKTTHGCTLLPTSRYSCDISLYEAIRSEVFLQEDGAGGMSWNTSGNGTWPQGKQEKRFALKCAFVLVFIILFIKGHLWIIWIYTIRSCVYFRYVASLFWSFWNFLDFLFRNYMLLNSTSSLGR